MQRYEISIQQPWNTHATEHGEWVKFTDAQATITRLTAERDQARAEAAAAYEKIARAAEDRTWSVGLAGHEIRALATEPGTTALAEMLDAEARACAEVAAKETGWSGQPHQSSMQYGPGIGERISRTILARIDQRKEAGHE